MVKDQVLRFYESGGIQVPGDRIESGPLDVLLFTRKPRMQPDVLISLPDQRKVHANRQPMIAGESGYFSGFREASEA